MSERVSDERLADIERMMALAVGDYDPSDEDRCDAVDLLRVIRDYSSLSRDLAAARAELAQRQGIEPIGAQSVWDHEKGQLLALVSEAREAAGWCKHDDGVCHADDPCSYCPQYKQATDVKPASLPASLTLLDALRYRRLREEAVHGGLERFAALYLDYEPANSIDSKVDDLLRKVGM